MSDAIPHHIAGPLWSGQCTATSKKGKRCGRRSILAYHAFEFMGKRVENATWFEACSHPEHMATCIVSILDIRHHTKKRTN
jgi:hypothetical protein